MKNKIFFMFFFLFLIFLIISTDFAYGIGITPAKIYIQFEPGYKESFDFYVIGMKPSGTALELYVKYLDPEFNNSVKLSEPININGAKKFTTYVTLPLTTNLTPGMHRILIGAREYPISDVGVMAAFTAVQTPIDIFVPYEGAYLKVELEAKDIAINETAQFNIKIKNMGKVVAKAELELEIYEGGNKIYHKKIDQIIINANEEKFLEESWNSSGNHEGIYRAKVIVNYDNKTAEDVKEFKIGNILIEILDFNKEFKVESIEPLILELQSKWNEKIENVYGNVEVWESDLKTKVMDFKTPMFEIGAWERKKVKSWFDTKGIEPGDYLMNITLYYKNSTSNAYGQVRFKQRINMMLVILIILIIIIVILITFLVIIIKKIKKDRRKKEEKKFKRK
ncbi:MAG: hypothetical protein QW244_02775 [Candidatus Pacearchaeota archaeon]